MLNLAMNAGILSSIFDGIKAVVDFFANFVDILKGLFQALVIYAFAPIYYLFMGICSIVNFAEMMFKKFAGIDPIMTNDGEMNILDVFIRSNEIWGLFVSILILSIVLLFLFTIVAVIKSEFALDAKGSAKGPIIARSLKSLAMFIIVPTVSLLGVYAVNAITDTINSMMKGSDDTGMVQQVFYTMSYNANKARINKEFAEYIKGCGNTRNNNGGAFKGSQEDVAYAIDQAFKTNQKHKSGLKYDAMDFPMEMIEAQDFSSLFMPVSMSNYWDTYSIWDIVQVNFYFSILDMDYIIGFGSAIVITYMLLSMSCVLIKRIFEIVILFLLAAPMISLAPLDGGSASKSWQKEFIKRVIAIVAPVFAINMYFIMIPLFMKISIFNGGLGNLASAGAISMSAMGIPAAAAVAGAYAAYDALFQIIAICVGMSVVKTASALLCNLLGIQDLVKDGDKQTKEGMKKAASAAITVAGAVATGGAAAGAMGAMKAAGGAAKAAGGALAKSEKGVSAAKQQLADAQASGDKTKIAEAQGNLDKATADRDAKAADYKDKQAKLDDAKQLAKEKKEAFYEKVGGSTYKGIKDVQDTWENRGQSKAQKAAKDKMKDLQATETAQAEMDKKYGAVDKSTGKRSGDGTEAHKHDYDVMARRAEGQVAHHYDSIADSNRASLGASQDKVKGLASEMQTVSLLAQGTRQTLQDINSEDRGSMTRGQKGAHTKRRKATEALYEEQVGTLQRDAAAISAEQEAQAGYESNIKAAEKKKRQALKAIQNNELGFNEDAQGNIGAVTKPKSAGDIAGRATGAGMATAAAGLGLGGGAVAVGQIIADNIHNKQMQTGANAINEAKTAHDETDFKIDEHNAAKAALQDQQSKLDLNLDGLSDEVEQGMKEAAGDLASKIKEAMQQGKLNVDGIMQLRNAMEGLNKAILNHQKNDQSNNELKEALEKLTKAFEEAKKK